MIFPRQISLLAALIAISLSVTSIPARAQEKVRLAHSALESSNSVWYMAKERGFYKKNGLDADLLFIPSTTTSVSSLVAGDVQVANASGGGVATCSAMIARSNSTSDFTGIVTGLSNPDHGGKGMIAPSVAASRLHGR